MDTLHYGNQLVLSWHGTSKIYSIPQTNRIIYKYKINGPSSYAFLYDILVYQAGMPKNIVIFGTDGYKKYRYSIDLFYKNNLLSSFKVYKIRKINKIVKMPLRFIKECQVTYK